MILNELIGLERDLNLGFFQNSKLCSAEYYLNQLPSVSAFNIHSFKAKLLLLVSIDIFSSASGRGNAVGSREESQCGKRKAAGSWAALQIVGICLFLRWPTHIGYQYLRHQLSLIGSRYIYS